MVPELALRLARPEDARPIADVHVRTWQDTYAGHMPADFLAALSVDRRAAMWTQVITSMGLAEGSQGVSTEVIGVAPGTGAPDPALASPFDTASAPGTDRRLLWVVADPSDRVCGFVCLRMATSRRDVPMSGRGISAGGGVAGETGVEGPGSADELAEIQALYVSPESQSRGVGGRLLEAALSRARATGVAGARLSVLAGNAGARRFYERYGFQLVRTSRDEIAPGVEIDHAHYALRWTSAGSGRMGTSR